MSARTTPKAKRHKRPDARKTKPFALHEHQPAGTKLCRRFMKTRTDVKAKTGAEARHWYRTVQL